MNRLTTVTVCAALLSGCATCREHPTACVVTGAAIIAAGAVAASHHGHEQRQVEMHTSPCQPAGVTPCN